MCRNSLLTLRYIALGVVFPSAAAETLPKTKSKCAGVLRLNHIYTDTHTHTHSFSLVTPPNINSEFKCALPYIYIYGTMLRL